jgi:hypothetical protein
MRQWLLGAAVDNRAVDAPPVIQEQFRLAAAMQYEPSVQAACQMNQFPRTLQRWDGWRPECRNLDLQNWLRISGWLNTP